MEDYPNGAKVDAEGYLTHDIEGRPYGTIYQAGRGRLDEPDHKLTPIDIQRVGEYSMEAPIKKNSYQYFDGGVLGETWSFGGKPGFVHILDSLPKPDADIVTAHEVGHVIDGFAGNIPTKGLERELHFVYNATNTGKENKYVQIRPADRGYDKTEAPRELMAEAIRAYMVDPNFLKTVAPQTAKRIREYVNSHPKLSKIIQFNSLAAGGAVGLGMTSDIDASQARDANRTDSSPASPLDNAYSSLGPPIPFELENEGVKRGSQGIAKDLAL